MKYTYNAVKFIDRNSFNKNKTKKNVVEYHDDFDIIVFEDTSYVKPNIKKVSHVNRVHNLNQIPTEKIIVRAHDLGNALMYFNANGIKVDEFFSKTNTAIIELPSHAEINDFWHELMKTKLFSSVENDNIYRNEVYMPPNYGYLDHWHLVAIRAQEGWDQIPPGGPINYVAVMDLGCETNHPDLVGRTDFNWNTYVSPPTQNVEPSNALANHGTPCAGLICANPSNNIDTIGVGGEFTHVQFLNPALAVTCGPFICLSTTDAKYVAAIQKAIENPACVALSMSFGGPDPSTIFEAAITDARTIGRGGLGIICCASMGNNGGFNVYKYPASYPGVLGIGATTSQGVRAGYSNYGANIFASAPGSLTPATDRTGTDGYRSGDTTEFNGTSAACPVFAGCVGVTLAANPSLTESQLVQIIKDSCNKIGPYDYDANGLGSSYELGYGQYNLEAAVALALGGDIPPPGPVQPDLRVIVTTPQYAFQGDTITISITVRSNVILPAAVTFENEIYYSLDQVLDPGDVLIDTVTLTIPQNQYYVVYEYDYVIPNTVSGDVYFSVYTDSTDVVNPEGELNNVGFSKTFIYAPAPPPVGLNLAVEILSLAYNAQQELILSCLFENTGLTQITEFSISKGFVGFDTYIHNITAPISSQKYRLYDIKVNGIPPEASLSTSPYRIEILSVNGIADDISTDNIAEAYIDPGDITPQP